ncbi:hypothetical protein [Lewinella sp. JB7]|uniref:hypothetical protein n=1 Tax=Lewinella sp. JB7 TaxID=2962887 RepID=UPI0020C94F98|nr:hypothetical protein [Lewinella sp. JB7]MCP9236282.1 hypothetical protein [Lewinella sp. JB7]
MNKLQAYRWATAGLLIVNLVLLAVVFFGPAPRGGPHASAREILGLDDDQHAEFLRLAGTHRQNMQALNDRQTQLLRTYLEQLATVSDVPPVPGEVCSVETEKVRLTYRHLNDIKQLLTAEQMTAYPVFIEDILQRILLQQEKNPPPPKDS